jgi:hypothetical protein
VHRSLREWAGPDAPALPHDAYPDPVALLANDRFGFALVVLTALAGVHWVANTLLGPYGGSTSWTRRVDDRDEVRDALRNLWRHPRWDPLIEVLVEPFGADIVARTWSAAGWLDRVIAAIEPSNPPQVSQRDLDRHRLTVAQIRDEARAEGGVDLQQIDAGYRAADRAAIRVARRAAQVTALVSATAIALVDLAVVVSYVVFRK